MFEDSIYKIGRDAGESDAEEDERGLTGTASLWFSAVNENGRGKTGNARALLVVQGCSHLHSLINLKAWKDRSQPTGNALQSTSTCV